ncbi:glycosyltransferase [Halodesulfurarchaeum sp. HSR-GB]|uniref:glycosyltransferase n=1 Tax=Halodesulfurarchaeum sp. HSR-GB TaxID=3074077 RepID=UPI002855B6BC|nr:glycosyltransferase [Halodesulfurarchaeum sp. HSR-GB]MDR5657391.1 glycosyltransferase [Halodesulfurarchaeum sp. HSR-GB]
MTPTLSVVIPVYNDPEGIRDTLQSLVNQDASADQFEILVVDNDSTDGTPAVIEEFESQYPDLVTGLEETEIQSSYAARNTGIEHASGELIGFLDADVTVDETWVEDVIERFEETDVDYLGCNVEMYIPEGEDTFWARYDKAMGLPVEHYLKEKNFAPTAALVSRSVIFESVGAFDTGLISGGDKEFGQRVFEADYNLFFEREVIANHPTRTTFQDHKKKSIRVGRGQFQLWKNHDVGSHPFSPLRIMPPNPQRLVKRGNENFKIRYYPIAYFLKLIQFLGGLKEYTI